MKFWVRWIPTKSSSKFKSAKYSSSKVNKNIQFNLDSCALNDHDKTVAHNFLNKNKDIFATELSEIGKTDKITHKIDTVPGAKPVHLRFYRQDPIKKAEIERQTNDMLNTNLIKPSTSEWNSPVVLVKKKDGSWRFAVDYRKLNQITIPISHPLPRVEDVFDAIGESKAKLFTSLDLNSAYFQIPLDPSTSHKSAFVTHEGVFEFSRMPFGLRNSPMSFQASMSLVLKGLNWKFVLCYIDDILIFSSNFQEQITHLNEVFQRFREANVTLKPNKCNFCVDKVMFLGHTITEKGVLVDNAKTDKIKNYPVPKSQKELRAFLGRCNYYRRFVKNFSKIAVPLNSLFKKKISKTFSKSDWDDNCERSFETLKRALISPPILRFPDMNKEFILSTDASGSALGYVLGQLDENNREYVVSYGGRAIRKEEKNWSVTELECLAVISGVDNFNFFSCQGKRIKYCKLNIAMSPVTSESCILSIFANDKVQAKALCNFRFLQNAITPLITELEPNLLILYKTPLLSLNCLDSHRMMTGCDFCIVKVPCKCAVATPQHFLHQGLDPVNIQIILLPEYTLST